MTRFAKRSEIGKFIALRKCFGSASFFLAYFDSVSISFENMDKYAINVSPVVKRLEGWKVEILETFHNVTFEVKLPFRKSDMSTFISC